MIPEPAMFGFLNPLAIVIVMAQLEAFKRWDCEPHMRPLQSCRRERDDGAINIERQLRAAERVLVVARVSEKDNKVLRLAEASHILIADSLEEIDEGVKKLSGQDLAHRSSTTIMRQAHMVNAAVRRRPLREHEITVSENKESSEEAPSEFEAQL
jgi:hypothetical protein